VPAEALSWTPTCGVPEIDGAEVLVNTPLATGSVVGEVAVPACAPDLVAVTLARIRAPTWSAAGVNALVVAPEIGVPLASHW
jgi:hypothetical protein